ncbi:MAG: acyltransferase [Gammaproteobacteria bacterium]|nr:acyltransferase [Gammaproteobacteria bacterium]
MLFKIMNKILFYWDLFSNYFVLYFLRHAGVTLKKNIKCYGMPLLSIKKGSKIKIGNNVVLRSISRGNAIGINHRIILTTHTSHAHIEIGDHVGISGGSICCRKRINIGDYTLVGANVVIADNDMHAVKSENRRYNNNDLDIPAREICIGKNVWIGADVFICKGVSIGDNSVIGAMSVVSKSIPSDCIAAGNPAKVIKKLPS